MEVQAAAASHIQNDMNGATLLFDSLD